MASAYGRAAQVRAVPVATFMICNRDYRAVHIPSKRDLLGFVRRDETISSKTDEGNDSESIALHKFIALALDCNPNILDTLFAPISHIRFVHSLWVPFQKARNLVLHQGLKYRYAGYAYQQLTRLVNHKKWLDNPDESDERYRAWRDGRNPERYALEQLYGYDTKHAAHLVRLLVQSYDTLNNGVLQPQLMGANLDLVRSVLNGHYAYEELIKFAEERLHAVKTMYSALPETQQNHALFEQMVIETYEIAICHT